LTRMGNPAVEVHGGPGDLSFSFRPARAFQKPNTTRPGVSGRLFFKLALDLGAKSIDDSQSSRRG